MAAGYRVNVICVPHVYMEKLADFYIGLYSQPGNLGQCSVPISTLFLFISLVTSIIHACMHIRASCIAIHACGTEMVIQLCCHIVCDRLRLCIMRDNTVHNNMTARAPLHANECFEVQFTHTCIREESQTSSQLHACKVHDELRDLLAARASLPIALMHRCMCICCYT